MKRWRGLGRNEEIIEGGAGSPGQKKKKYIYYPSDRYGIPQTWQNLRLSITQSLKS
jgi:hypothetical protein